AGRGLPAQPRQGFRFLPRLEVLEGRCLPSTVTNLNDSGPGSLRDAIATTPAGGIVDFQPGLTGTINLTSGPLMIGKALTITGPGAKTISVKGGFIVTLAATPAGITGLTITQGGLENDGTLTLDKCALTGNILNNLHGGLDRGPINNIGILT